MKAPELTQQLADEIAKVCKTQLETSRRYKQPRLAQIKESEDFYLGIVKPQLKNVFNIPIPFMAGFVDHLESKIDDPPTIEYGHQDEADLKKAKKISAAWQNESSSALPHAKWPLKDRWVKRNAIFSGRGIFKFYAESDPKYRSTLNAIDINSFHFEPAGGGHLENHMFCGEDDIFKTKEEILEAGKQELYDLVQVARLVEGTSNDGYRDNSEAQDQRNNRHRAFGLDPETNNYTGQNIIRLAEFYTTYKGFRWYCLFDERTGLWLRVKRLSEVFEDDLWPHVSWATHEDSKLFLSKAPADDARPIHDAIQTMVNQELYNRHKKNLGQRAYDVDMFHDVEALAHWRPDGLVPVDTKLGTRSIANGIYEFNVGELNGTINLAQFLNSFAGEKMGVTPGSQGVAEEGKKVGIYFGELQQVADRLGLYNKSYSEAWSELGLRYVHGLDQHLSNTSMAIKLLGAKGVEWSELTKGDLKTNRDLDIKIVGGSKQAQEDEVKNAKRLEALRVLGSVNPKWRDRQILLATGYSEEEIKEAFEATTADRELLSEAAQAEEDIVKGRTPKLNRGANASFMQHIIDFATSTDDLDEETFNQLLDYAMSHKDIAIQNEARNAAEMIRQAQGNPPGAPAGPAALPATSPTPAPAPLDGAPASVAQRMTSSVLP